MDVKQAQGELKEVEKQLKILDEQLKDPTIDSETRRFLQQDNIQLQQQVTTILGILASQTQVERGFIELNNKDDETETYRDMLIRGALCLEINRYGKRYILLSCLLIYTHFVAALTERQWELFGPNPSYKADSVEQYAINVIKKFNGPWLAESQRDNSRRIYETAYRFEFVYKSRMFSDHYTYPEFRHMALKTLVELKMIDLMTEILAESQIERRLDVHIKDGLNWGVEIVRNSDAESLKEHLSRFEPGVDGVPAGAYFGKVSQYCILDCWHDQMPDIAVYETLTDDQASHVLLVVFYDNFTCVSIYKRMFCKTTNKYCFDEIVQKCKLTSEE